MSVQAPDTGMFIVYPTVKFCIPNYVQTGGLLTPTVIVKVLESVAPDGSEQTTSIVETPVSVGVPENTPVAGLKESQVEDMEF